MPFDEPEQTELIDVASVSEKLAEETVYTSAVPPTESPPEHPPARETVVARPTIVGTRPIPATASGPRVATVAERFVASWIDCNCLWLAYWGGIACFHKVVHGEWLGPAPWRGQTGLLFHAGVAVAVFLYFIITEGIFFATIGKLCCGLVIRRKDGRLASYLAIIGRNLLRPLDALIGGLPALLMMEATSYRQRIGDFFARTVVIKRQGRATEPMELQGDRLAGTATRVAAGVIDAALLLAFAGGAACFLRPSHPVSSHWILLAFPFSLAMLSAASQAITGTSPGKWLCGYDIVQETGERVELTQAVIRTVLLPLDWLGVGLAAIALSPRGQRLGDAVAGTVIHRAPRRLIGGCLCALTLLAAGAVGWLGWQTPGSWLKLAWKQPQEALTKLTFAPRVDRFPDWPPSGKPPEPLAVANFRFAAGSPETLRTPAVYLPGETVYFLFEVRGFKRVESQVWFQQDLAVRYPDGNFGLRQENIIDRQLTVRAQGPIDLINNINLPPTAMPGKYTVFITLRDKMAGTQVLTQETFEVKGDVPPPQSAADAEAIERSLEQMPPTPVPLPAAPEPYAPSVPAPAPVTPPPASAPAPVSPTPSESDGPTVMPAPPLPPPPSTLK